MPSRLDIPKTKGKNEPNTFTSKLIGWGTSSSKESLRSTKVDEGKCENDIGISSLSNASYFTMKATGTTFTTYVVVPRVSIVS
jgi:hypothetical protein